MARTSYKGPLISNLEELYKQLAKGVDGTIDLEASFDFSSGTMRWKSGQVVSKKMTDIVQKALSASGSTTVSISTIVEAYQQYVTDVQKLGQAIDALGRCFEEATAYRIHELLQSEGGQFEGEIQKFSDYAKRLMKLGLDYEKDIAKIDSISQQVAQELVTKFGQDLKGVAAVGGSNPVGDLLLKLPKKGIVFELKWLAAPDRPIKWFTLTDGNNFASRLLAQAKAANDSTLWGSRDSWLPTNEWVGNIREFATNEYAKHFMVNGKKNPSNFDLLKFLVSKGKNGQEYMKAIEASKKGVIRGFSGGDGSYKITLDLKKVLNTFIKKVETESTDVSLNFMVGKKRIANLTTSKSSIEQWSIDNIEEHKPLNKKNSTFLFYLQAGFFGD